MSALRGGLAGAAVSASLWAWDLASLRSLSFAGASDAVAQQRMVEATRAALLGLEARLLGFQLLVGFVLGALAALALARLAGWRGRAVAHPYLTVMAVVAAWQVAALLAMVGTYPQLFADRWWLGGGVRATLMRVATHGVGPRAFDAVQIAIAAALAVGALAEALSRIRAGAGTGWPVRVAARAGTAALVIAGVVAAARGTHARGAAAAPNVLIVASDSMRTDRLESREVMPFTASLVPQGTLFRYAFTPVARTFPSWVSILTGTEPRRHGIRTMFPRVAALRGMGPTFATVLRDAGYHTFVVSDFAGDIFPRFDGGFEAVDTPTLTVDRLSRATVLAAHTWSLPLLRIPAFRGALPEWRNLASMSDPEWLADAALGEIARAKGRPFAGVVFFSTAHFPYVAPAPDYRMGAGGYRGRYLYHAPPTEAGPEMSPVDVAQVRARYDGALRSVDRATERLVAALRERGLLDDTLLVITSDHGEVLYEAPGMAGHGDSLDELAAQAVPILLVGPGVARGAISNAQVRVIDLGATVLDLAGRGGADAAFGDGVSLLKPGVARPLCLETDIWFWPTLPAGLRGRRLEYEGIAELVEVDPETRQLVLRADREAVVEAAKERGLVSGRRLWRQRLTPSGLLRETLEVPGVEDASPAADLQPLFADRCVAGDPDLAWLFDGVVMQRRAAAVER